MSLAHKGQILPIVNQMIPIDKTTVFHANYDYDLNGFNQGELVAPEGLTRATLFNGVDVGMNLGTDSRYDLVGNGEISVWVKPDIDWPSTTTPSVYRVIAAKSSGGGAGSLGYYMDWTGNNTSRTLRAVIHNGTTGVGVNATYDFKKEWTFLVFKWDEKRVSLSANGVILGVATRTVNPLVLPNAPLTIGSGFGSTTAPYRWSGSMSDLKIQSNNEVIGHWPLDEKQGSVAYDKSSYGNDTMITGGLSRNIAGPIVASIKKGEGKFKSAALIEPETYNAFKANEWSRDTADVTIVPIDHAGPTPSPTYLWSGSTKSSAGNCYLNGNTKIDFELFSTKWTFSCYLKRADGQPVTDVGHIYMYAEAQGGTTRINVNQTPTGIIDCGDGWYRVYRTETVTGLAKISLCGFSSLNKTTEWYINGWMLEPCFGIPSSYLPITNSRAVGRLTYPNPLQDKNNFTISLWMKQINQVNQRDAVLCIQESGLDQNGVWIDIDTGVMRAFVYPSSGAAFVATTTEYDVSNWCHITVTGTDNTLKLFVNGKLKATQVISSPYKLTGVLSIGRRLSNPPYNDTSNIMVDELRIEARAISEEEVLAWAVGGLHYNYLDYSQYVD